MSFIDRKVFVSVLFLSLTLLGWVSYRQLDVELLPNTELPMLYVRVSAPSETDPKHIEQMAVIPLEGLIATLENIEDIESRISPGSANIIITLTSDADPSVSYLKLLERIKGAGGVLPEDFSASVTKVDMSQMSNQFMRIQVRGNEGSERLRTIVEQQFRERFENINGIASVEVFGGRNKSVEVIFDDDLLKSHNLTVSQIRQQIILSQTAKVSAGKIVEGGKELLVSVVSELDALDKLENIVLKAQGPVRLKDVAVVNFGYQEVDSYSRVNGKEAVTITLTRESQENLVNLSEKVLAEIETSNIEFESQGLELVVEYNSAEQIAENIDNVLSLAISGGLLAVLLLWVFLRNIYLVFVAMVAIPVTVYSAFNVFYAANVSINVLTLVGLALAIGMLIDNNVVVMENIHRLAATQNLRQSVIKGTKQIWRSVVASTLTTIVVFLPFVFTSNPMFKLVAKHISVSIVTTLLISMIVALVLVPVYTYHFLKRLNKVKVAAFQYLDLHNGLVQTYIHLLKFSLRYPIQILIGAIVLLFASLILSITVSVNTAKETETNNFYVSVHMPTGATLESTDLIVRQLENKLDSITEMPDVIAQVGSGIATITIKLPKEYDQTIHRPIGEIRKDIESRVLGIEGAEITVSQAVESSGNTKKMGGGSAASAQNFGKMFNIGKQTERVVIKGEDFDKMLLVANDVKYYLEENIENLTSVAISTSTPRPEIHLGLDNLLMGMSGISPQNIAQELGVFKTQISSGGTFEVGTQTYDIVMKSNQVVESESTKKNMTDLKELQIESSKGSVVPLVDVSQISYATGRSEIQRLNQKKTIEVVYSFSAEINESNTLLDASREEVKNLVASVPLPQNVSLEVIQEENVFDEFKYLILAAVLLIYMILASVFESFSAPLVMMFTVPLAAIGSLLALTVSGTSLLSLNTLVGFLILLGVVVNNGILLLDCVEQQRREGMTHLRALILAGISRIRPVLITAGTTIIAMVPLAMGQSEYVGSLGAPFAITVIGGLTFSTLLTLIMVPTLSFGLETSINWFKHQTILIKIAICVAWLIGGIYVFYFSDVSLIWELLLALLIVAGAPALAWFVTNSLRQAKGADMLVSRDVSISIRNLVKVYERPNWFVREYQWRKKAVANSRFEKSLSQLLGDAIWQIPLLVFTVYFIWFYVESGVILFISSILFYYLAPYLFDVRSRSALCKNIKYRPLKWFINVFIPTIFRYGFPLFAIIVFQLRWDFILGAIFIGIIWYGFILVSISAKNLNGFNKEASANNRRWNKIKHWYFLTISKLPFVAPPKVPFKALKRISLEFKTGMIGLLGPNGAGKTTLMRNLCGVLDQSYGKIFINGVDTNLKREELQGLIGYLPQEFGMYENMSSFAFLDYMALLKGLVHKSERHQRVEYVLKAVHMWERRNETIGSYSGGMKQRIGIAMILLHLPKILVVDEPTAGLDPSERIRFRNLLVELSRERVVLFSTHIIEDISSSCNQVAVMAKGNLKYWGEPKQMIQVAKGKVWQATIEEVDFERINKQFRLVHHVKNGNQIIVRCLSETQPFEGATPQMPLLEDAYLLLLS